MERAAPATPNSGARDLNSAEGTPARRVLSAFLFEARPTGPLVASSAVATLALAAILASYLPARRSSRLDSVAALRE